VVACVGKGRIEIHSTRSNGLLRLGVTDNGPGLQTDANSDQSSDKGGLGFSLTKERLERLYGRKQQFSLQDAIKGGLQVMIEIPFVRSESEGSTPKDD
jgi:LytS/YehU family sensor histidine kinase